MQITVTLIHFFPSGQEPSFKQRRRSKRTDVVRSRSRRRRNVNDVPRRKLRVGHLRRLADRAGDVQLASFDGRNHKKFPTSDRSKSAGVDVAPDPSDPRRQPPGLPPAPTSSGETPARHQLQHVWHGGESKFFLFRILRSFRAYFLKLTPNQNFASICNKEFNFLNVSTTSFNS